MTWGDRQKVAKLIREIHDAYDRHGKGADVQEALIAATPLPGEIIGGIADAETRQRVRDQFVKGLDVYIRGRVEADAAAIARTKLPGLGGDLGGTGEAGAVGAASGLGDGHGGNASPGIRPGSPRLELPILRGRPRG